jgi:hypothetical protein
VRDQPEPTDSARRVHTYWVVRRRYKRARWVAAAVGALTAALLVGLAIASGGRPTLGAVPLILVATAIPWLIVEGLWRRTRRRHFWDWQ